MNDKRRAFSNHWYVLLTDAGLLDVLPDLTLFTAEETPGSVMDFGSGGTPGRRLVFSFWVGARRLNYAIELSAACERDAAIDVEDVTAQDVVRALRDALPGGA